jgi:hypothetical protein
MGNETKVIFCYAFNEVRLRGFDGKHLPWTAVKNESCLTEDNLVSIDYGLDYRGIG